MRTRDRLLLLACAALPPVLCACGRNGLPQSEILPAVWSQYRAKYLRSGPRPQGVVGWQITVPGRVAGSAAVTGGLVFFTSYDPQDPKKTWVHAVDARTGATRWVKTLDAWSLAAPAVASRYVYVGTADGDVQSLRMTDGKLQWTTRTGGAVRSTPILWEDLVIAGSDDKKVYGLDAGTGAKRWEYATRDRVDSVPIIRQGVLYIGSRDDRLHAVNPLNGHRFWMFETGGDVRAMPVLAKKSLYLASMDGWVSALDAATATPAWTYKVGSPVKGGLACWGDLLYAVGTKTGLHAIDPATGKARWSRSVPDATLVGAPAVVDGVVYLTAEEGWVLAFDARSGEPRWRFRAEGAISASPVVVRGHVYVGTHAGKFYALK